jgi:hypothetical protein
MRIASLSLLTVCCLLLAVAPVMADTILYSNGPYNGNVEAWTINFGFSVSDSFNVGSDPHVKSLSFVYWDGSAAFPSSDLLTTVDMQIGSTSFGGSIQTLNVTNTFLTTNSFGFSLYQADSSSSFDIPWSGAGYLTLSNACTMLGCSTTPIYWDENDGVSTAYENTVGSIGSEAFTLSGTRETTTPEPGSITLFASGILGVFGVLRRKLMG